MTDSGAEAMMQAIVRRACDDWRDAVKRLNNNFEDREASGIRRECERFFNSQFCYGMTGISGKELISLIRRTL